MDGVKGIPIAKLALIAIAVIIIVAVALVFGLGSHHKIPTSTASGFPTTTPKGGNTNNQSCIKCLTLQQFSSLLGAGGKYTSTGQAEGFVLANAMKTRLKSYTGPPNLTGTSQILPLPLATVNVAMNATAQWLVTYGISNNTNSTGTGGEELIWQINNPAHYYKLDYPNSLPTNLTKETTSINQTYNGIVYTYIAYNASIPKITINGTTINGESIYGAKFIGYTGNYLVSYSFLCNACTALSENALLSYISQDMKLT